MTYATPQALRTALEDRLRNRSAATGVALDRLRRRVLFERVVARLEAADPGDWVLKGGMALEVRLHDDARLTKDIDLGLRAEVQDSMSLHERLVDTLTLDPQGDRFGLAPLPPELLGADRAGHVTWRVKVAASLAGKPFGGIHLDISPRAHELIDTEHLELPNSLDFAGIPGTVIEIINVNRHAAEKFHAMLRDYGDRENSRVRDLVDVVLLVEHRLLTPSLVADATRAVWRERDDASPPLAFPSLPESWPDRYERLCAELDLDAGTFTAALAQVERLWFDMFTPHEA